MAFSISSFDKRMRQDLETMEERGGVVKAGLLEKLRVKKVSPESPTFFCRKADFTNLYRREAGMTKEHTILMNWRSARTTKSLLPIFPVYTATASAT